jgi:Sensors of blue-light using FAD
MLVRLMYCSRTTDVLPQDALSAILNKSRSANPARGITGVLCYSGKIFLQVLEGGRMEVNALYNRISGDNRHHDVMLLLYEEIAERCFSHWSMGQVSINRINPSLLIKYSERAELNPYAVSGKVSMALFNEMMATASIVGQNG